jgi:hypothetical protein
VQKHALHALNARLHIYTTTVFEFLAPSSWLSFPAYSVPTKSQKDNSVSIKAAAWLSPLLHDMFDDDAENEIEVLI